jgi:hypothetical protein
MFATVPPPSNTPFNLGTASSGSFGGWKPVQGVTPYLDPTSTKVNPALVPAAASTAPAQTTQPVQSTPDASSPYGYQFTSGHPGGTGAGALTTSSTWDPHKFLAGAPGVSMAQSLANQQIAENKVNGLPPWYTPQQGRGYGSGAWSKGNSGGGNEGGPY